MPPPNPPLISDPLSHRDLFNLECVDVNDITQPMNEDRPPNFNSPYKVLGNLILRQFFQREELIKYGKETDEEIHVRGVRTFLFCGSSLPFLELSSGGTAVRRKLHILEIGLAPLTPSLQPWL